MKNFVQRACPPPISKLNLGKTTQLLAMLSVSLLGYVGQMSGQINYWLTGPYEQYPYSGPYTIKTKVYFVESPTNKWANDSPPGVLADRVAGIAAKLNSSFNPYQIFFVNGAATCDAIGYDIITQSNFLPFNQDGDKILNIFDFGGTGVSANGLAYSIPSTFLGIADMEEGIPGSQTNILIHEVGHCLGLTHLFTDDLIGQCNELTTGCGLSEAAACYCCGDFVCDTPIDEFTGAIIMENDCSQSVDPLGIIPETYLNYMSYSRPSRCRDRFSPEQVKRMWAYLSLAPQLQGIQVSTHYPANVPSAISGNIVVESGELIINSDIEMLPNSYILVKPKAKLRIAAKITGACEQMWQGVIVEGSSNQPQTTDYQGLVTLVPNGKVEHALVGIDTKETNSSGFTLGGGIIRVFGGRLENNSISIRFWPYINNTGSLPYPTDASQFIYPRFTMTDKYRGTAQPVFMDLNDIGRLRIENGRFHDERTNCTDFFSQAIGISAKNAGFKLVFGDFRNLAIGILADQLTENTDAFTLEHNTFTGCYRNVISKSNSGFSIREKNTFNLKKPEFCPSAPPPADPTDPFGITNAGLSIGVSIRGNSTDFHVEGNVFQSDIDAALATELGIGTESSNTLGGLHNNIRKNAYNHLHISNWAIGDNTDENNVEGLIYTCNTSTDPIYEPDYKIEAGGMIKPIQDDRGGFLEQLPTGNIFNETTFTPIINNGSPITYYYSKNNLLENPGTDLPNIQPEGLLIDNYTCADPSPCPPPCRKDLSDGWKKRFFLNQTAWINKRNDLASQTDPAKIAQIKSEIDELRLAMNQDGGRILTNYRQDTVATETDSITTWLGLLHTYATDLRLARHYFFTDNYAGFDKIWTRLQSEYTLGGSEKSVLERLEKIYTTLREQPAKHGMYHLQKESLSFLMEMSDVCDEAGYLAEALLWRNGIMVQLPCGVGSEARSPQNPDMIPMTSGIKTYPVPANGNLTVEYPAQQISGSLCLINLQGRILYKENLPANVATTRLDTHKIPAGIYFIEIRRGATSTERAKIVIAH